ncbi:hypothetical protein D3C77_715190 [compost metagenome]
MLSAIHKLYFYHLVSEAIEAQSKFNQLWQNHDMDGIRDLLYEVKAQLKAVKKVEEPEDEL